MFEWMAWTTPVAVFFTCIVLMLAGMTLWELKSPTTLRRGFLPLQTTRGDRLFIGLLSAAYVNLIFIGISGKLAEWLGLEADPSIWIEETDHEDALHSPGTCRRLCDGWQQLGRRGSRQKMD